MKSQKGFTLIELLVVIAIIALLLSILLPSLRTAKAIAQRVVCSSQLKGSGAGFHAYASDNNDELPASFYAMPKKDGSDLIFTNMDMPWRSFRIMEIDSSAPTSAQYPTYIKRWTSNYNSGWDLAGTKRMWSFGALYDAKIIENGENFYCPAVARSDSGLYQYETYIDGHSWPWWNTSSTNSNINQFVHVNYYYLPQSQKKKWVIDSPEDKYFQGPLEVPMMAVKASHLNANYVMSVDMMADNFFTHKVGKKRGVNALYGDGSVAYSHDPEVFRHEIWDVLLEDEQAHINNQPALFRAIIKGIEGNTSYMDMISF